MGRTGALAVIIAGAAILAVVIVRAGSGSRDRPATTVEAVQTTADLVQHLTRLHDLQFGTGPAGAVLMIHVDDAIRYQRIVGVGAAMTDSSAWLLEDRLSPAVRDAVMRDFFGAGGIHLRIVRVPIGASDFTRNGKPYSYDDVASGETDPTLSRFSVAHDDAYIIPALREARRFDPGVQILATPWSPPGWMKTNDALGNFNNTGRLLRTAYGPWARYFVRFIQAYTRRGVPIHAITPQNEPGEHALFPGLNLSNSGEAIFIAHYLGPALRRAGLHPRIYALDSSWRRMPRARALVASPSVAAVIAGLAWQCYRGNPTVMSTMHRIAPRIDQIVTECASAIAPGPPAEMLIASFRNWASAVLLWNLALDPSGGPVEPPNSGCPRCRGVVTVDGSRDTVTYGPDYYALGQLGEFVEPGARRISSNTFVTYNYAWRKAGVGYATAGVDDVAFRNPDGTDVLVTHNNATRAIRFAVSWRARTFTYLLAPGATVSFRWR